MPPQVCPKCKIALRMSIEQQPDMSYFAIFKCINPQCTLYRTTIYHEQHEMIVEGGDQ